MKKNKIIISLLGFFGIIAYFISKNSVLIGLCKSLDYTCRTWLDSLEKTFFFFFFFLLFFLITYKLPKKIFISWSKFALVATPIVLGISLYINLELHHSPSGDWQNIFDAPALWLLYILFSIGSLVAIYVGWRKGK